MKSKFFLLVFLFLFAISSNATRKQSVPDAALLRLMLKKLTVVVNALYVGAHPDDENTAILSYLSLGRGARTAYLSLNRGEGGQNLIGAEQGPLLGVIRTQELLAARTVDQAEQFFTRAVDFGYSKTPEESFQIWGKERVLSDVVWVIRNFQPDIILTRFPPEGGGHGHHTASALLAQEAFAAAADRSQFSEQLKYVEPWQAKRIMWNRYTWGNQGQLTEEERTAYATLEVGSYSPLLGKSFTELAGISRSMHKSQGFGDSQDRGRIIEYIRPTAGEPPRKDIFDGVDITWKRISGSEKIEKVLLSAYADFDETKPEKSLPQLFEAYALMEQSKDPRVQQKKQELINAIRGCAGLWLESIAADYSVTSGSSIQISATAINRSDFPFRLEAVCVADRCTEVAQPLQNNTPVSKAIILEVPTQQPYTQPYWLEPDSPESPRVMPEAEPPFPVQFVISANGRKISFSEPVLFRWVDPVQGERYRRLEIVPEVAINMKEDVLVFTGNQPKSLSLTLLSGRNDLKGEVRLRMPDGWKSEPASFPFEIKDKNRSMDAQFRITPSNGDVKSGNLLAEALIDQRTISHGRITIDYAHIGPQTIFPQATAKLVRVDVKSPATNIGYILGSGDEIPAALRQLGLQVAMLSDEDLATKDLSVFHAIVAGVRAYNTRTQLKNVQPRLMKYVEDGGTYVVQYQTQQDLVTDQLGPYPFRISRDRVSVEGAAVNILKPKHPMLNHPNKISASDFDGWVQERGLYFPNEWDAHYETVLSSNDPGEPPKEGGVLYARYGKGVYVYTGYSWFRQLPAGVPGAYRLFVNFITVEGSDVRSGK